MSLYHNINGSFVLDQTKYYGELDPDTSTVLLMHFNNDSSVGENDTYVYDWSGNGNNGTVIGATYNSSAGRFFGAFEFKGSVNYINISDSDGLDITTTCTVEF